ncbi:MAG: AMP-binding protein [Anaerovorax sp.]
MMDQWIKEKINLAEHERLTREAIQSYQLKKLKETLDWAREHSRFYGTRLGGFQVETFSDFEKLPFTTVTDLRELGIQMLCVGQNEVSRIVTLDTSGTTGKPKRVYYTEEDQELTIDFFNRGMENLVNKRDRVLILLPYERPGSVGDLLAKGLARLGASVVCYGLLPQGDDDLMKLLIHIKEWGITSMVGAATQVARLALESEKRGMTENRIATVLLSVEYVSKEMRETISRAWNCQVFEHYGMTEMGLGGGVSCFSLEGYHPREADLYFEMINPETGAIVNSGEYGEVVFTTLTRKAMPFIRYRTGDVSRWLEKPCICGSPLKRLDRVGDRKMRKGGKYE